MPNRPRRTPLSGEAAGPCTRSTSPRWHPPPNSFWTDLVPHAGGVASYVNFMSEFEEDRILASYGAEKYQRLSQIKAKYDPTNLFHLNANIRPATA